MTKLKRYNQIVLAILGTTSIFLLLGLLAWTVQQMVYTSQSYRSNEEKGIILRDTSKTKQKRQHLIHFREMELIDSLNGLYILPVTQTNWKGEEEYIDYESLVNKISSFTSGSRGSQYSRRPFNNLIIYEARTKQYSTLYQDKVSIVQYQWHRSGFIVIKVITEDTNADGYLNYDDLSQLHIYHWRKPELVKFDLENKTFIDFVDLLDEGRYIAKMGVDINQNGSYDFNQEASYYYNLDLNSGNFSPMISEEDIIKLQRILDENPE